MSTSALLARLQHYYRHLRRGLCRAWDGIASWHLQLPVRSRIPLLPEVLFAISLTLIRSALTTPAAFNAQLMCA
jgi:hypothetical protein